jgi:urease accessory protein
MSLKKFTTLSTALTALAIFLTPAALAHSEVGAIGGFQSGFLHPIFGPDHVLAMVGVGILGAFLGSWARWGLPIIFPLVMAVGGVLGISGVPIPSIEVGIALSSVVIGALIASGYKKFPLWLVAVVVGIFAIFHGHAHGAEMPEAASALTYAIGFVLATGLLHLAGIAIGLIEQHMKHGTTILRITGGIIALLGLGFLFGIL